MGQRSIPDIFSRWLSGTGTPGSTSPQVPCHRVNFLLLFGDPPFIPFTSFHKKLIQEKQLIHINTNCKEPYCLKYTSMTWCCFRRISVRKIMVNIYTKKMPFFKSRVLQIEPGFQAGLGGAQRSCRLYGGDCRLPAGQTPPASGDENSAVSRHKKKLEIWRLWRIWRLGPGNTRHISGWMT